MIIPQMICKKKAHYAMNQAGRKEKKKLPREDEVGEKEKRDCEKNGVDEESKRVKIRMELMKITERVREEER
jgi:hypothetical protein